MTDGGPGKLANAVTVTRGANTYDEWVEGTITLPLRHLVSNPNNRVRMLNHRAVSDLQAITHAILPPHETRFIKHDTNAHNTLRIPSPRLATVTWMQETPYSCGQCFLRMRAITPGLRQPKSTRFSTVIIVSQLC